MKWLTYTYLHSGYRRVMLKSYKYNMDISPASLLVKIKIEDAYWNNCDEWIVLKYYFFRWNFYISNNIILPMKLMNAYQIIGLFYLFWCLSQKDKLLMWIERMLKTSITLIKIFIVTMHIFKKSRFTITSYYFLY